jgi:hypothetical protein
LLYETITIADLALCDFIPGVRLAAYAQAASTLISTLIPG